MADGDDWGDDFGEERFGRRKERRRPKGARRRKELATGPGDDGGSPFADPGLEWLHARGLLKELGNQVRGGKEATLYRANGPVGRLAAKVYSDIEVRGFRAAEAYLEGRRVADRRIRKLLGDARRRGLSPELADWVFHEYLTLWRLHDAGVRVPLPAVGPDPEAMVLAGRVVLMEWIGDEEPAPRLSDVQLDANEAERAWQAARLLPARLLEIGLVHGDLSTFNLLWWAEELVLIDLPQAVEVDRNPAAADLLQRDIRSLCSSFAQLGIEEDAALLLLETRQTAGYPASGPLRR
ncbi:MAG TPA: RIO1 family regulatory kinase/ATPase [Trueperaceae bacterium]